MIGNSRLNDPDWLKRDYEKRLKTAERVCRKWLKRAPVWSPDGSIHLRDGEKFRTGDVRHVRRDVLHPTGEMETPWLEDFEKFLQECAHSVAIAGGFPRAGRFRFERHLSRMRRLRWVRHKDALVKVDDDGDFYNWYHGSIFRKDKSATSVIIVWRRGKSGSGG